MRDDVFIAGAGPTGMVLALWLNKLGIQVRIIDKSTGPGTTSRAMVIQARTLELYRQLDLADAVLGQAHRVDGFNIWVEGKRQAHLPLGAIGEGLTPYPFLEIFPQDRHEKLLVDRLEAAGVFIQRQTELTGFTDHGTHITAHYRGLDGKEESAEARYIVGCDGARSVVRSTIGASFPGGTYRQIFYVADVEGSGPGIDGDIHIDLDQADFLLVMAMDPGRRARLIGAVSDERAAQADTLQFSDVSKQALHSIALQVDMVNWFSTYHVHHRVADHFRQGNAFLAGDAGHIHSPVGGQGMNTGIGDAINLAWKLAAVLHNEANEALLATYEAERLPFARQLVQTTDRVFSFATAEGRFADILRTRIAPLLLPVATHIPAAPEFLFRTVSQTMLSYREGPLAEGKAGHVRGGDRLPWAQTADGHNNFDALHSITWQVHVYGTAQDSLKRWCDTRNIALHAFAWTPEHEHAGLAKDAAYLIRPDMYVAVADPHGQVETLERYCAAHGLILPARAGSREARATTT